MDAAQSTHDAGTKQAIQIQIPPLHRKKSQKVKHRPRFAQSPTDYSIVGEVKSRDLKKFSKDEVITFEKKFAEVKKWKTWSVFRVLFFLAVDLQRKRKLIAVRKELLAVTMRGGWNPGS